MDAYILSISFIFGVVGFIVSLFEVRSLHLFIVEHQGIEELPVLDKNNSYKSKDIEIRKFRRFILNKKNKESIHFSKIRKMSLFLNVLSILCFSLFGTGIAYFYFA